MRATVLICILLCVIPVTLIGEESVYTIGEVTTRIDGWARESFLLSFLSIDTDRTFLSIEDLESYIEQKKQKLINKRLFREVDITYTLRQPDNLIADLEVYVMDGAPVFFLPYYKYDSNYGHQFGSAFYLYDVLGSLTNLMVSGGYAATSFDDDPYKKVDWDVTVEWDKVDFFNFIWSLKFRHHYLTTELIDYETDAYEQFYKNYETSLSFSTGARLFEMVSYSFKPSFKWNYGYDVTVGDIDTSTKLFADFTHGLGYSRLNWVGNKREGYGVGISQNLGYDFFEQKSINILNTEFKYFHLWWIFQLSTRGYLSYNILRDTIGTSDKLRGILDSRTSGQFVYTENFDISTKLFTVPRITDVHGGAFIDVGFMKNMDESFQSPYYSAGIEGLFFPLPFKSLTIRGTLGVDLRAFAKGEYDKWELEIGQSLSY